jgi:hypothetical protein
VPWAETGACEIKIVLTVHDVKEGSMSDKEETGLLEGKSVSRREFLKIAGMTGAAIGISGALGGLVLPQNTTWRIGTVRLRRSILHGPRDKGDRRGRQLR